MSAPGGRPPERDDSSLPPLPPLPPHLRNRPDRPRGEADVAQGRSQARLILLLLFAAIPFVVLLVVVLNSLASGPPDRQAQAAAGELNQVTRYCIYKTQRGGPYDDCLKRSDPRVIRREDSNAARYGRGELTRCLADAGPRCTLR
jgi:hypothetical protein